MEAEVGVKKRWRFIRAKGIANRLVLKSAHAAEKETCVFGLPTPN